jgi:predicted RNA-binding Zn-ribbon protein involved in translation (DUF1610 family)
MISVACISCARPFDARTHAGLVRCPDCAEAAAPRIPAAAATTVTFDSPADAWA